MSPHPSILFSSFQSPADPQRIAWLKFRDQSALSSLVARGASSDSVPHIATLPGSSPSGIWRLLAPNNRELGRSSFLYSTFSAARNHVLQLRESPESITVITVKGPIAKSFGWIATLGNSTVMTCSRWSTSAAAALAVAEAARASLTIATVAELPLRTTSSGRRTNHSSARPGSGPEW